MAQRPMWKGMLQFGLMNVPIKMYAATEDRAGLSFNMLCKDCLTRIQTKTHCPTHGEIPRSETVRGYEWTKGSYVVMTEADFDSVPLPSKNTVSISAFIPADVTPLARGYYYLGPEEVGAKAYTLLNRAMQERQVQAIARICIRERESLCLVSPHGDGFILTTLLWPDEIRDPREVWPEPKPVSDAEMGMALQLVDAMAGAFEPDTYKDEYREALVSIIEAKIDGTAPAPMEVPKAAPVPDLMAALAASVEAARRGM